MSGRSHLDPLSRFQFRVIAHGDCYRWTGNLNPAGYGTFNLNNEQILAHRFAYEMAIGPIPAGLTIDHLCRNRWCVRPSHLEAVTAVENSLRGDLGRHNLVKTHCPAGHPYSGDNLLERRGERICLQCKRRRDREAQARRRAKCRAA